MPPESTTGDSPLVRTAVRADEVGDASMDRIRPWLGRLRLSAIGVLSLAAGLSCLLALAVVQWLERAV